MKVFVSKSPSWRLLARTSLPFRTLRSAPTPRSILEGRVSPTSPARVPVLGRTNFSTSSPRHQKTATSTPKKAKPASTSKKPKKKPAKEVAAKPAANGRTKKPLSEDAQAALEKRQLKKAAILEEPSMLLPNPYAVFLQTKLAGNLGGLGKAERTEAFRDAANTWASMSESEIEGLRKSAAENRAANEVAYKAWVESIPPAAVLEANRARRKLKIKYGLQKIRLIKDDRMPKRPLNSFLYYWKSRRVSDELSGLGVAEIMRRVAGEWKAMSESEKQPFHDLAGADRAKFLKDKESAANDI